MAGGFVVEKATYFLGWAEREWTPFKFLWWRYWTPDMGPGDRYPSGRFEGYYRRPYYGPPSMIPLIYKAMPYVQVRRVEREWDWLTPAGHQQRNQAVWDSTMHAYFCDNKPLYSRETIRHVEDQLDLIEQKPVRRAKVFAHTQGPRSRWISYKDYDDVVHWERLPPTACVKHMYDSARAQIEFRSIQELVQPDQRSRAQFLPDQWEQSIAYQPLYVIDCPSGRDMRTYALDGNDQQLSVNEMQERLAGYHARISGAAEWQAIRAAAATTAARKTIGSVDKIVFFCHVGLSEDDSYPKQTLFLLQLSHLLRTLVRDCRDDAGDQHGCDDATDIPIYVPAFLIWRIRAGRKWNDAETQILQQLRIVQVESVGKLFLLVDENTAVMSYGYHAPVKQVIADLARPAIMICKPVIGSYDFMYQTVQVNEENLIAPVVQHRGVHMTEGTWPFSAQARLLKDNLGKDPDSPRVRRMLESYDQHDLPPLPDARPGHHYEVVRFHVRQEHAPVRPVFDLSSLSVPKSALPVEEMYSEMAVDFA